MFKPTVNKKVTNKRFNFNFQFYTLNAYRRQQLALFLFLLKNGPRKAEKNIPLIGSFLIWLLIFYTRPVDSKHSSRD